MIAVGAVFLLGPLPTLAQTPNVASEIEAIKAEMRRLQERLERLEQSQRVPMAAPAAVPGPAVAQPAVPGPVITQPGEREITLEKEHPLELLGLGRPELGGFRLSGFFVGSFSYNSHIQMVPEFAGGAPALADPGRSNVRFDKFGLSVSKTFAPWLSAGAAIEVESHRDRHSHGFDPAFGCPGTGPCVEQFGSEEAETEVNLDKFNLTVTAPVGNGLNLSLGRFDAPFGIERHDEPLNLTATTSEVFQFGRPQRYTGFQTAYQFAPWLDAVGWAANRWESETTHDPFDDNNKGKTFGGRIGFTPVARESLLNFGIGGSWGPEQDDTESHTRWVVDFDVTWNPTPRFLLAGELIYGGEDSVSFRKRGTPIAGPAVTDADVNWLGFSLLAHYDLTNWLGLSFRYGYSTTWTAPAPGSTRCSNPSPSPRFSTSPGSSRASARRARRMRAPAIRSTGSTSRSSTG
jgi:hypothetical protein